MRYEQSAQKAKDRTIFIIVNNEVEESTLYDHVMKSARENKIFYERNKRANTWEVKACRSGNRPAVVIHILDTWEEAEDEIYMLVYNYDFLPDDQRDTQYWFSEAEAMEELKERQS